MGVLRTDRNWGGKAKLYEFTQGIEVDARLARQEVRVQKAWARGLLEIGALSADEYGQVRAALDLALERILAGDFAWRIEDEDIHMNLERFVTEQAGVLGKKVHLGRSRNDLIATTLRLYVADEARAKAQEVAELILALIERADKDIDVIVPGQTHVQNGQPVRHSHVLASHAWALARDLESLRAAKNNALRAMPLGSAALAGTPLRVPLERIAAELGFHAPPLNSYDAVGDRDFCLDLLHAYSRLSMHLSRLAEDCVLWASSAMSLVKLPPDWSTGSSIMPNKRNPDVAELVRGKSAHVLVSINEA